jgi:predicted HicB family RNase H-like nuclease
MALQAGKPSNKTQKELAIEAVQEDIQNKSKPKMHRFNVDIPETLHREMKIRAVKEGVTLNILAAKLFEDYLNKNTNE